MSLTETWCGEAALPAFFLPHPYEESPIMPLIETVLGNANDPEWRARLAHAHVDTLDLSQWDAQKSRLRKTTRDGLPLAVSLERGEVLRNGDVLLWDDAERRAVVCRMIADVPLGAFLSGGYDSSLMTAIAQAHSKEPVKTFSIGFHEERYNEAKYAKEVAEYLGTKHTELYIDEAEMLDLVESIPLYYDEPFADSSQIPTMLVSMLARKDVTVALSGDGGDEFFCGYNIYENVRMAQQLDMLGGLTHGVCGLPGLRQMGLEDKLPFRVRVIAGNRNRETKTQFGAGNYVTRANRMVKGEGMPCHYPVESGYQVSDWQVRRMLLDMDTYLPGDILCKVDRASMKYSLEARCPILDKDVMEYSFRMAHNLKYEKGNKKRILKDIAYDYIPKRLLERPKVGFGVPLDKWLRGPLKEQLTDMCSRDYLKRQGIFDAEFTADMIENYMKTGDGGPATGANYSKLSWSFFIFEQWYQRYL